jgi:hypothetical protein
MQTIGLEPKKGVAVFEYDFAKHGGAVGDIEIDPKLLPRDAVVTSGVIHVKKAVTSGGAATVAFRLNSAGDILAATAISGMTLNALIDVVPDGSAANMVRTTQPTKLTMTIGTAPLTGGKAAIALEYFETD